MNIDKFTETIKVCRFCFMCRHLSGIGNVTFTEADTPRIRASLIYGATMYPEKLFAADLIDTMYRSDLSGACRRNCVNHYDEVGLTLAYRQDIVENGYAPEYVKAIVADMQDKGDWKIEGTGKVACIADQYFLESGAAEAFAKLAPAEYMCVSGGCCGKGIYILGFRQEAKAAAEKLAALLNAAGVETVVAANPAVYDMLKNTMPELGVTLNAAVMHSTEYLAGIRGRNVGEIYYLESDFLRNYNDDYAAPKTLLAANGAVFKPFGTNDEESYSCAEGALVLEKIDASLVEKLAKYIEARADDPANDRIVTPSPYTCVMLKKYTSLKVQTVEEVLAEA